MRDPRSFEFPKVNFEVVHYGFYRQVEKDCEFLEAERIMDYSLLVGVHFRGPSEMPLAEG